VGDFTNVTFSPGDLRVAMKTYQDFGDVRRSRLTPGKTNMSSENQWFEDVFPIEIVPF